MKEKRSYMSYSKTNFQITQISIETSSDQQTYNTRHSQPSDFASHESLTISQLVQKNMDPNGQKRRHKS